MTNEVKFEGKKIIRNIVSWPKYIQFYFFLHDLKGYW